MDRLRDELRQLKRDTAKIKNGDRRDKLRQKIRDLEKRRKSLKDTGKDTQGGHARAEAVNDVAQTEDEYAPLGAPLSPGGAADNGDPSDSIDVDIDDTDQAFGRVEPFGTEDQGQKLTDGSVA